MTARADVIENLRWRGLIHQTTDDDNIAAWLTKERRVVYAGFDPTASSMHVGNLMPVTMLRRFQQAGHRPIALVGGSTGMIGDPSGKSAERNLLSPEVLAHNLECLEAQLRMYLDFDDPDCGALVVNNYDWMQSFSYLDFLRDVGKNFPVNVMMAKDSVRSRLESEAGLSYTEFSYMLLQAYDFVHLHREYKCEVQVGGSDQWGNITAGIDLGRRMDSVQLHAVTCPLLTKSDGTKMGKTETGSIWLDPDRTSPYEFYQYWLNVADEDAGKCLRFLTDAERDEVEALERSIRENPQGRECQKALAAKLTELVHGTEGVETAQRATAVLFGSEIQGLTDDQLVSIFADVPSTELERSVLEGDGLALTEAMVSSGLAKSKGEARRTIDQGGGYVNNRRVADSTATLKLADLASETVIVLRSGRRKYALLRFPG